MTPAEMVKLIDDYERSAPPPTTLAAWRSAGYSATERLNARSELLAALPAIREALAAWAWLEKTGITVFNMSDGVWSCFAEKPDPETIGPTPLAAVLVAMGKEQPQQPEVTREQVD